MCWVFLIFTRFLSRNLYIYNKSQGALHCYLPSLGGANAATPHYPTVELRVFGGLGVWGLGKFRVYGWSNTVSNLRYATCPNHPNHFGIIFDSGWDPRSKIQDCPGVSPRNLGSWILDPGLNQKGFQNDSDDSGK